MAEPLTESAPEPSQLVVIWASTCSRGRAAPKGLLRGARGCGGASGLASSSSSAGGGVVSITCHISKKTGASAEQCGKVAGVWQQRARESQLGLMLSNIA